MRSPRVDRRSQPDSVGHLAATDAERQHDSVVASGSALAGENVVHHCGVETRFARNLGPFESASIDELAKKFRQRRVDRLVRIEIAFDARAREQPLEQVFGQVLFFHGDGHMRLSLPLQHRDAYLQYRDCCGRNVSCGGAGAG